MKILHISNFYYNRGGDCTYLLSLMELLNKKGHKNIIFSMKHHQNIASEYSRYFTSHINYVEELKRINIFAGLKVILRAIFSFEARDRIEQLIRDEKPDIAHIQSLHHHLTHSILYPLKKYNIPIVWTLHDYALICPNTLFLSHGQICEKCRKKKYYWSIFERCKKDSLGASAVAMIETTLHRIMNIYDCVDVFITPSDFLRNKLIEYGIEERKIVRVNNFIDSNLCIGEKESENYSLFVGRLSSEKGIRTLIDAIVKLNSVKLKIVGDGVLKDELKFYVNSITNNNYLIEFLEHKSRLEVIEMIKKCNFVVLPSECYENFPFAVLEAFACGKPVIGSRIGGIPELVRDNNTGLTFEPGNSDDLAAKINYLENNPGEIGRMGMNARQFVQEELNSEKHYERLMYLYNSVISKKTILNRCLTL